MSRTLPDGHSKDCQCRHKSGSYRAASRWTFFYSPSRISAFRISDNAVPYLIDRMRRLPYLRSVSFLHGQISPEGEERIRKALPTWKSMSIPKSALSRANAPSCKRRRSQRTMFTFALPVEIHIGTPPCEIRDDSSIDGRIDRTMKWKGALVSAYGGVAADPRDRQPPGCCTLAGLTAWIGYARNASGAIRAVMSRTPAEAHRLAVLAGWCSLAEMLLGLFAVGLAWYVPGPGGESPGWPNG